MNDEFAYPLLSRIDAPADLRRLSLNELEELCKELRHKIISELSEHPGHFASNLGTVELTVALHYALNTPYDRIVWDVGHQAYAHKILTGRREAFSTNRQYGGLRPFPSPDESEYDTFTCGHASNSISAALGMAVATWQKGEEDRQIVAVIGDGALGGGLAFEGINNASCTPNNLLIILNDNNMSIDKSVGGLKQNLQAFHTSKSYNAVRYRLASWGYKLGLLNDSRRNRLLRFNNSMKSFFMRQQNIFDGLDVRYFGPVNGHDVRSLVRVLNDLKQIKGPKLLHIHTVKGKGYAPAEQNAEVWHAPGRFDRDTGQLLPSKPATAGAKYQDVFGHTLLELARMNPRIVGITPAMPSGCSMNIMMREMPGRVFDVGIAEGHAVTFSAGLATEGMQPFCNVYSTFMQRAYDNLIHDVAIARLPVVLCLDRAGLVGADGPTHHGVFDLAYLRAVPNITVASPYDECELRRLMFTAQQPDMGPFVIRYPRGRGTTADWRCPLEAVPVGKGRRLKDGSDVAVLAIGPIGQRAMQAIAEAEAVCAKTFAMYDLRFLKPLDEEMLREVAARFWQIVTVEEGVLNGGMGSAVVEWMADHGYAPAVKRVGIADMFVPHGDMTNLNKLCHLGIDDIKQVLLEL